MDIANSIQTNGVLLTEEWCRFFAAEKFGVGLSLDGPQELHDAYRVTKLPILAMGGVYEPRDAVELMLAGATAVAVGTATFSDPSTAQRVADGIAAYCRPENKVPLGFVEGFNNKIRAIQKRAYGLRDEEYLRLKILTCMLEKL